MVPGNCAAVGTNRYCSVPLFEGSDLVEPIAVETSALGAPSAVRHHRQVAPAGQLRFRSACCLCPSIEHRGQGTEHWYFHHHAMFGQRHCISETSAVWADNSLNRVNELRVPFFLLHPTVHLLFLGKSYSNF
jgi:hypothetical protein